ncbi:MAG: hypothetical protein J6X97_01860 [Lachnospiraceae bacterium]|nr:hypothetical protein [Lachnospiraceae bacterium]
MIRNKKTNSKKLTLILVVIIAVTILFTFNFFFGKPASLHGFGQIPELRRIAGIDAVWYDIDVIRYDGTTMTWVNHRIWYQNEVSIYNFYAREILNTKGRIADDWTPDDLAYPMFAFEIEPRNGLLEFEETGEMMVYSNGYLITQTGNVYECGIDFMDLMVVNENDFLREVKVDDIMQMSCFRPLAYANHKWNADYLSGTEAMDKRNPDIEATIVKEYDIEGIPMIDISLKNNGEKDWHYEEKSIFFGMIVFVDGEWYYLNDDPAVDAFYGTFPTYGKVLKPGDEVTVTFFSMRYGELPDGRYCIVICGREGDDYNYACAPYRP